uniref:Large ribosomal subunit protein uL4c n=1 Tax=Compsopogon caeruleus TaxID=31354 RepID=A0A1Z1XBA6_9RHOD|nr:50S ribosomal protein L4 [Compsopogon caeruleus]ARX96077.1 50S ribosomal protein L4 [Compsopogon caeruleus]
MFSLIVSIINNNLVMVLNKTISYAVYDWENNIKELISLDLTVADKTSAYVVHRALIAQQTSSRQGSASTKTRSEVRGGGRKPWKQKGTGKARAGSNRSPLWKGGGVIFGPKPTVNYIKKINQKEMQLALRSVLLNKFNNTLIVENFDTYFDTPSTKQVLQSLINWQLDIKSKILIIVKEKNYNLYLSVRNIPNIDIIAANNLNIMDLLNNKFLVITTEALKEIGDIYNG